MIHSISITKDGTTRTDLEMDQFSYVLQDPEAVLWVDLSGESGGRFEQILQDIFGFHPLAIDDALRETHIPKVDDWGQYIYLVMRGVSLGPGETVEIQIPELDIYLGTNYMVTYHETPLEAIDKIWRLCQRDHRYLTRGTANLFYHLADEFVNQYMLVIEQMEEIIEQIEDDIFDTQKPDTLNQIFSLKRALLQLRRTLLPQREVFNKLARGDFELIQDHDRVYFRDVYDHLVRLQEINESLRDLVGGALDIYMSVINNRMNEIMKVLTIIATTFIPLSFFTGIYGMNFIYMPELQLRWGYFILLAFLGMIFIGMLIFFKRKKWI
jgi:magnesium transporter